MNLDNNNAFMRFIFLNTWFFMCVCVSVRRLVCCSTLTRNIRHRRGEKIAINVPSK